MTTALLELTEVCRHYASGDETITALDKITLSISAGEMVALVGPSGSGKSTLLNVLGCLDRPTAGSYRIAGQDTREMPADALARLRREHFGYVFQRYHLLPDLHALDNVAVPAVYAGMPVQARHWHAQALLERLGLDNRSHHRPHQLSGGQQQRVSIARALMNGGQVILADEPTGSLDRHHGQEVIQILTALHAQGHTVIVVTHDMDVARHAQRIVEINDGRIVSDTLQQGAAASDAARALAVPGRVPPTRVAFAGLVEAFRMAWLAMHTHRLRSLLTMLGIIIGIASVVSVAALGEGSRRKILDDIRVLGTNTIVIFPGKSLGDRAASSVRTLTPEDAEALAQQPYADGVTPEVVTGVTLRYRNMSVNAALKGVGASYFHVHGLQITQGAGFASESLQRQTQDVVIDEGTRQAVFGADPNPVGQLLIVGSVPFRVIGIARRMGSALESSLTVWVPYAAARVRIMGPVQLQSITLRVRDGVSPADAEQAIVQLLSVRHGEIDFFVQNNDRIRQAVESTAATMTLLGSMIAVISLVVGGIGVMNTMLVSVTERTAEIGVRMAVGARQADVMQQFLIEAVLMCLVGGVLGVVLALGIGLVFSHVSHQFRMVFSVDAIAIACLCSTLIGLVFGFVPARNAARLDPILALARE